MTPAVKQAEQQKIAFNLHHYHHDANAGSFGLEAAEKLGVDAARVFKTLVISTDTSQLAVAIVPVNKQLNLKALAKALNVKKVLMADAKKVVTTTGYVLGGVSPLGQKKRLPTVVDISCQTLATIYVSGGKRGLEIELAPLDLARLTSGVFADIAQ